MPGKNHLQVVSFDGESTLAVEAGEPLEVGVGPGPLECPGFRFQNQVMTRPRQPVYRGARELDTGGTHVLPVEDSGQILG
jgi:hypothetical protein